jgi:putative transposase
VVEPTARREVVQYVQQQHAFSQRRACRLVGMSRATVQYHPRPERDDRVRHRLRDLAAERHRFGYRRLWSLLRREGYLVNRKRVERLYREEGLTLPRCDGKRPKRQRCHPSLGASVRIDQRWAMDFIVDSLTTGRRLRLLTVEDTFSRECLAIEADVALSGQRVVQVLARLAAQHRCPQTITVDNGPEFICKAVAQWATERHVHLHFIRPGTPTDNPYIESFHGRLRAECLNEHLFHSVADAQEKLDRWRQDYNTARPHSALNYRTPTEFRESQLTRTMSENTSLPLAE